MELFLIGLSQYLLGQEPEGVRPKVQRLKWVERLKLFFLSLTSKENKLELGVLPVEGFFRCHC